MICRENNHYKKDPRGCIMDGPEIEHTGPCDCPRNMQQVKYINEDKSIDIDALMDGRMKARLENRRTSHYEFYPSKHSSNKKPSEKRMR